MEILLIAIAYRDAMHCRDAMHGVSTTNNDLLQIRKNKFGPQRKNLSSHNTGI